MTHRLLALALMAIALGAQAQGFPNRPVTLVVPFPPGGGTDTGARIVAQKLGAKWGQTVVVENKGGAAGMIGADLVAKARPDGYTILMGNIGTQAINPSLYKKMPYDPAGAFAPIELVAELPLATLSNVVVQSRTGSGVDGVASRWLPDGVSPRSVLLWLVLGAGVLALGGVAYSLMRQMGAKR